MHKLGYKLTPNLDDDIPVVTQPERKTTGTTRAASASQKVIPEDIRQQEKTQNSGQYSVKEEFHRAIAWLWQQHRSVIAQNLSHIQTEKGALTNNHRT